jgi:hypothetical protein
MEGNQLCFARVSSAGNASVSILATNRIGRRRKHPQHFATFRASKQDELRRFGEVLEDNAVAASLAATASAEGLSVQRIANTAMDCGATCFRTVISSLACPSHRNLRSDNEVSATRLRRAAAVCRMSRPGQTQQRLPGLTQPLYRRKQSCLKEILVTRALPFG